MPKLFPGVRAWGALCLVVAACHGGAALARNTSVVVSKPFEVSTSPAGNYLAALVAGADRDTLAASTFFREALRFDPRNRDLMERAFVASVSNGNMREAFPLGERMLRGDPKNGLVQLVLGVRDIKAKQFGAARSHLSQAGGGRQRDVTAVLLTAWTYAGGGDTKRALDTLDKLNDERFAPFRDYHAGLIAAVGNNFPEAMKRLKAAYEADRTNQRVVEAYGRFVSQRGDAATATQVFQGFNQISPRHPLVLRALGDLAAGKVLEPLVPNAIAGASEVLFGLGAIGAQQNDSLAAMIYLRMAQYLLPENYLATVTLADIYERLRQDERAIETYDLVPDTSPLRANADIQTGLILEIMGRSDDALKVLQGLVDQNPKDIDALNALANLQRSRKLFAESAQTYTKILDLIGTPAKSDWTLFYFRGIGYERSKQWPLAEADFRKALAMAPDQPMVLNYLGYSWVDQGINLDEAIRMLRRAVDLRPTDGYIVDSLGWANYKLGRYDEALQELEKAIELKPGDPVVNDHLGDVYWKMGRKLEAHFQWNHARDLNPEPEDYQRILAKINDGLPDDPKPAAAEAEPTKQGG